MCRNCKIYLRRRLGSAPFGFSSADPLRVPIPLLDAHLQNYENSVHDASGRKGQQGNKRCVALSRRSADVSGFPGSTKDGNEGNVHYSGSCCSKNESVKKVVVPDGFGAEGNVYHFGPGCLKDEGFVEVAVLGGLGNKGIVRYVGLGCSNGIVRKVVVSDA